MSKFIQVYNEAIERFEKTGPIIGDYVKFNKNTKSSDWYKMQTGQKKEYIDNIMSLSNDGKLLMLTNLSEVNDKYKGVDDPISTIKVEISPGLNMYPLEVPANLLDYHMDLHTARTTYTDPTLQDPKNKDLKTEIDPKYKEPNIGQTNQIKGGNYILPNKNSTLKYM